MVNEKGYHSIKGMIPVIIISLDLCVSSQVVQTKSH